MGILEKYLTKIDKSEFSEKKNNSYRKDETPSATYYILYSMTDDTKVGWEIEYIVCEKRVHKETGEKFYCTYEFDATHKTHEGSFFVPEEEHDSLKEACKTLSKSNTPNADLHHIFLWDEQLDHNFYTPRGLIEGLLKKLDN